MLANRSQGASPGVYTLTLTITDSSGLPASTSHQVAVDELPTAGFTVRSAHPAVRSPVSFDGKSSHDADGSITSYSWSFGDGSAAGSGTTASHTYASAGTYTVTLTVTDSSGLTATVAHQIKVVRGYKITHLSTITNQHGSS